MESIRALLVLLMLGVMSCNIGPKPIAYGTDACHFCKMTIVDKQHAAEFVTKKGKVYKFDASECMLNQLKDFETDKVALFLVNDYASPGELVDATKATFLISNNLPSPMGEFLSAFESEQAAKQAKTGNEGQLFTWDQLLKKFNP
ncbi:nitrous oxide reductase accessory protein NosL [Flagellimonas meishanensis]|uniref:nitrous oxide reductase accessory protein NosL n=1 Tax=Flagellimonas meishanensis TaxID=2873264 RepID=UPI001CA6B9E8|nr:nitrous oxide reductase accessory protein NosL [[Muricauda] meishanensis]